MSTQSETLQRLEDRIVRVQTELSRDLAAVRDSQATLERRVNELPQQQRTTTLPGQALLDNEHHHHRHHHYQDRSLAFTRPKWDH